MAAQLRRDLDAVLRDLQATGAPGPEIVETAWQEHPGAESVLLRGGDGSSTGVWVNIRAPEAERIAALADQAQEWLVEELWRLGRPTNWPPCPDHPDTHPLAAVAVEDRAAWSCPTSGRRVCEVGRLTTSA